MPEEKEVILITGACGLLGTAIAKKLSGNYRIVGFDLAERPSTAAFTSYHPVDMTSDESVRQGLAEVRHQFGRLASVIHLAAYYSFSEESSPLYEKVTVQGTMRLLRELQSLDVGQFLFSSTMLVHAPTDPGEKIDETSKIAPKWAYPESKQETEEVIRQRRGDIPTVIARIAGVYDDECHSIPLAHQIQRMYERQMTARFYPGDLYRGQAFVHLEDLAEAVFQIVERRAVLPPEEVFLIGEETTLTYDALQRRFGELIHGRAWVTSPISKPLAKTGAWLQEKAHAGDPFIKPWMIDLADDHYELDISHAERELGWVPQHSLEETLPRMIAALKADPVGWYRKNKLEPHEDLKRKAG